MHARMSISTVEIEALEKIANNGVSGRTQQTEFQWSQEERKVSIQDRVWDAKRPLTFSTRLLPVSETLHDLRS
jgi:hypothetical protein